MTDLVDLDVNIETCLNGYLVNVVTIRDKSNKASDTFETYVEKTKKELFERLDKVFNDAGRKV